MNETEQRPASILNCDGCTLCCRNDAILLHPELGDDVDSYITEPMMKDGVMVARMLAHKPDGDCIYLDEGGCTIYETRPLICREFNCMNFVRSYNFTQMRKLMKRGLISSGVIIRGKQLLKQQETK